ADGAAPRPWAWTLAREADRGLLVGAAAAAGGALRGATCRTRCWWGGVGRPDEPAAKRQRLLGPPQAQQVGEGEFVGDLHAKLRPRGKAARRVHVPHRARHNAGPRAAVGQRLHLREEHDRGTLPARPADGAAYERGAEAARPAAPHPEPGAAQPDPGLYGVSSLPEAGRAPRHLRGASRPWHECHWEETQWAALYI
ncbi:unnamed protein product, partial [Prorocentrum cordatum]